MSATRDALVRLQNRTALIKGRLFLANTPLHTANVVAALGALDAPVAPPRGPALEVLRLKLLMAPSPANAVSRLPLAEMRDVPWLLWSRAAREASDGRNNRLENHDGLLAPYPGILDAVIQAAARTRRVRQNLIEAWLAHFLIDAPRIEEAGHAIARIIQNTSSDFRLQAWRDASAAYHIFDARLGPGTLADAVLEGDADVIAHAQLDDPMRARGGYMRAIQDELLGRASETLHNDEHGRAVANVTSFLRVGGQLRFNEPMCRGQIAKTLLGPWLKDPLSTAHIKDHVRTFLLEELGDPRTRPQNWDKAGDGATQLFRKWLADLTLREFFEVIADHASKQFKYRRKFWLACLPHITDARVALGSKISRQAKTLDALQGTFATLKGVGSDQAVLFFKIGKTVFCEWSQDGALRAWPSDWPEIPDFSRSEYQRPHFQRDCLPFPPNPQFRSRGQPDGRGLSHINSEESYWQGSVSELISRREGIHLSPSDWMPS